MDIFGFLFLFSKGKRVFFLSFMEEKVWEEDSDEEVGKEKKEGETERAGIRGWCMYWLVGYPCLLAYLLSACKLSSSLSSVSSSRYFAAKDRGACLYLV